MAEENVPVPGDPEFPKFVAEDHVIPPPELNPGEEIVDCPKCQCPRRQFTIVDGQCDSCRNKAQQTAGIITVIGWPEVRHRRNLIMSKTDWAVLSDQPESRKN